MTQKTLEERVANRRETHNLYSNIRAELDRLARQVKRLEQYTPESGNVFVYYDDVLKLIREAKR
jgi:predicted oxidoreductase (fatty acid repression mutant protein)